MYYRKSLQDKNQLATTTLSFVEERIAKVAGELDSIENSMKNLKNNRGIIDLSEQGKLYLASVSDNDRRMTDINMKLAMLDEVEKYVASSDAEKIGIVPSLSAMSDQKFLSQLLEKLYNDQMQYQRLIKTVPAGNPAMFSLKNEIDKARPSILENVQNERRSLEASRNRLNASTGSYRSMLSSIPQKEKALLEVSRQQAIKNDAYAFLLQKREEAALAHAAMVTNSRTINEATASFDPVSPKKAFAYLSALAIAFLLGFSIVYAKERLTNRILFRSDIEKLNDRPVVAEIMSINKKQRDALFNGNDQISSAEQFIQLRAAMRIINKDIRHRKLLITSSGKGEGKSFITSSLAASLLHSGKKIIIVDFDIRDPKTTVQYNLTDKKGLAEYLEQGDMKIDEIIYPTNKNNLYVIPAGKTSINAAELLINNDLTSLFEHLEKQFDFILIDSCPVDPFIDANIISDYCDATLFVIRHGYTKKTILESLTKSQKMATIHNLFIVFNGVKPRGFLKHNYGTGYGYGFNKIYPDKYYQMQRVAGKA
jgi:capsular exopolysaccharide synthesis family protein